MISGELARRISQAASAALLRIGESYYEQGLLHHALTPFLKIVACYPETDEAPDAVDRLLAIAEIFEEKGQFRMAMSVYDRMEHAARSQRWNGRETLPAGYVTDKQTRERVAERRLPHLPSPDGNGDVAEK